MSRSYHLSHSANHGKSNRGSVDCISETDKKYKVKNKYKDLHDIDEYGNGKVVKWKKKKHLAYGELRNFNFNGKPTYCGEAYSKLGGEYISSCIEPRKERRKNKLSIYENYEDW